MNGLTEVTQDRARWFEKLTRWMGTGLFVFVLFVPHRYLSVPLWDYLRWFPFLAMVALLLGSYLLCRSRLLSFSLIRILAALLVLDLLSGVASLSPLLAVSRSLYLAITGMGVCLILYVGLRTYEDIRGFWRVMVVFGALCAVLGIVEFVMGHNVLWESTFNSENPVYMRFANDAFGRRIIGTVGHPVFLGATFGCFLPISLHLALSETGRLRALYWVTFTLILVGLILTFTRGAYAAALAGLAIYIMKFTARIQSTILIVVCLVVGITLSYGTIYTTLLQRDTLKQIWDIRTDQRGIAYRQATQLLVKSPVIGLGSGHYRYFAQNQQDYNQTLDNMYLRILVESGIAGLIAFAYMVVSVSGKLSGANRSTLAVQNRGFGHAIHSSFVVLVIAMFTCDALGFSLTRFLFWGLVGSGIALISLSTVNKERTVV